MGCPTAKIELRCGRFTAPEDENGVVNEGIKCASRVSVDCGIFDEPISLPEDFTMLVAQIPEQGYGFNHGAGDVSPATYRGEPLSQVRASTSNAVYVTFDDYGSHSDEPLFINFPDSPSPTLWIEINGGSGTTPDSVIHDYLEANDGQSVAFQISTSIPL